MSNKDKNNSARNSKNISIRKNLYLTKKNYFI